MDRITAGMAGEVVEVRRWTGPLRRWTESLLRWTEFGEECHKMVGGVTGVLYGCRGDARGW